MTARWRTRAVLATENAGEREDDYQQDDEKRDDH
jgi:hypothetical protein